MTRTKYLRELYARLVCAHCGAPQSTCGRGDQPNVILHHPNGDGHLLRRAKDIPADDLNWIACIDAEVARCVPLCRSCHGKEHDRMRVAAGGLSAAQRLAAIKKMPRTTTLPGNIWTPSK
jgi:hypothetical protein